MIYNDLDELEPMENNGELSLYQAIWDIDYFLQQGYIKEINKELSMKSVEILKEFYASKDCS